MYVYMVHPINFICEWYGGSLKMIYIINACALGAFVKRAVLEQRFDLISSSHALD